MALFLNYLIFCFFQQREVMPYWNLSVKILHAKIHRSYDYGETISFQIHLQYTFSRSVNLTANMSKPVCSFEETFFVFSCGPSLLITCACLL